MNFYYDADGKAVEIGYNKGKSPEKVYIRSRNAFGDVDGIYTAEAACKLFEVKGLFVYFWRELLWRRVLN